MKEKLRVTSTVWENLPENNRRQLMVILGEMAYNAVKSAHTRRRNTDEDKKASSDKSVGDFWNWQITKRMIQCYFP